MSPNESNTRKTRKPITKTTIFFLAFVLVMNTFFPTIIAFANHERITPAQMQALMQTDSEGYFNNGLTFTDEFGNEFDNMEDALNFPDVADATDSNAIMGTNLVLCGPGSPDDCVPTPRQDIIVAAGQTRIINTFHFGDIDVRPGGTLYVRAGADLLGTITVTGGTFNMQGGVSRYGDGIILNNATLNISGGEIREHFSFSHQRLIVAGNNSVINMTGGVLKENGISGGKIACLTNSTMTMSGGVIQTNFLVGTGLTTNSGVLVGTNSSFMMTGGNIRGDVYMPNWGPVWNPGVTVHQGGTFRMDTGIIENSSVFVNGGEFYLSGNARIFGTVYVNSGNFNMQDGTVTEATIIWAGTNAPDYGGVTVDGSNSIFIMTGGSIRDIYGTAVRVRNRGLFTMSGTAEITGNSNIDDPRQRRNNAPRTVAIDYIIGFGGELIPIHNAIQPQSFNQADINTGVFVTEGSSFIMNGGSIHDNSTAISGGGVLVDGASFTMNAGTIRNNSANTYGGGVRVDTSPNSDQPGIFNMYGGTIEDNTATSGGAVSVRNGYFNLRGGTINNNTATENGGGIHLETFLGQLTATSGNITNNTATFDGGGIWTDTRSYGWILTPDDYDNLTIHQNVIFGGNRAGNGSHIPPYNWEITEIRGTTTSPTNPDHRTNQLNNYDVGYRFDGEQYEIMSNRIELRLFVGQSEQLRNLLIGSTPLSGRLMRHNPIMHIRWWSNNTNVATVNQQGVVRIIGIGTTQVCSETFFSFSPPQTSCRTVQGVARPVTHINISTGNSVSLQVGQSVALNASAQPTNATNPHLSFNTDNGRVATVTSASGGRIHAHAPGTTVIRVTGANNQSRNITVTVTAAPRPTPTVVTGVSITGQTTRTLNVGESLDLTANIIPEGAFNQARTWRSSNTSVATVNDSGRVIARMAGQADITVTTNQGGHTATVRINVTQSTLNLSSEEWTPGGGAHNTTITVRSNVHWTPSVRASDTSWLSIPPTSINRTNNTFRINTTANQTQNWRHGEIRVTGGGITRIIHVRQEPSTRLLIGSNQTSLRFDTNYGVNRMTIPVLSNTRWSVARSHDWILLDEIRQPDFTNDGSFRITTTVNEGLTTRTGTVRVTGGNLTRTITITQLARPHISVSRTEQSMSRLAGNSLPINVTTNQNWEILINNNDAQWLSATHITPVNQNGNGSFRIRAEQNPHPVARTGQVIVRVRNSMTLFHVITVTQAPTNWIELSGEIWNPGANAMSSDAIRVTSNVMWSADVHENSRSWLSFTRIGNYLRLTAQANPNANPRRGHVIVSVPGDVVRVITVTQMGRTAQPPSRPTGLSFSNITYNSAILSWSFSTNATTYRVYHYPSNELLGSTVLASMFIPNLAPDTVHRFTVVANGAGGDSQRSLVASFRTEQAPTIVVPPDEITRAQEDIVAWDASERAISLMYAPEFDQIVWNNATPDERKELLRNLFYSVHDILEQSPQSVLHFQPFPINPDGTFYAGTYSPSRRQTTINSNLLNDFDSDVLMRDFREAAMLAVIHEARHEFQHNATLDFDRFTVSMETREYWWYELFMIGGSLPNYTTELPYYFQQAVEWDAWHFMGRGDYARDALRETGLRPVFEGSWPWNE